MVIVVVVVIVVLSISNILHCTHLRHTVHGGVQHRGCGVIILLPILFSFFARRVSS